VDVLTMNGIDGARCGADRRIRWDRRRLARMLASEGARLVLAARRKEALKEVAGAIRDAGGVAVSIVTDLAADTSLANLVERTRANVGPIDIWGQQRRLRGVEVT